MNQPEFLDTEWYEATFKQLQRLPARDFLYLDIRLVKWLAQDSRLRFILNNDKDILDGLRESVKKNGIQKPVVIKTDSYSHVSLYDGHHRLIVAEQLGLRKVPVLFETCELLRIESKPVSELIRWFME